MWLNNISDTAPQDIKIVHIPYARTSDVLRGHVSLLHNYYNHNQPNAKCNICDNTATMRYVCVRVTTLLCDVCRHIRSNVPPEDSNIDDVSGKIKILHAELPTLRNVAKAAFERMLYRDQLVKFYKYGRGPCVLCHHIDTRIYDCNHDRVLVCDRCELHARDNIAIRIRKMYLGTHVIATIQQHDVYISIVRLYLALLWDVPHT